GNGVTRCLRRDSGNSPHPHPLPNNGERGQALPLFPAFLKLAGRRVVVIGGGAVAASKLLALREAGAVITVVAPTISAEITGVELHRREFAASDLDGAWLVIAAATPEVNRAVAREAESRRIFVNAVDDPTAGS